MWLRSILSILFGSLIVAPVSLPAQGRQILLDRLDAIPGWSVRPEASDYTADEIEALVGDAAERVRDHGVVGASRRTLTDASSGAVVQLTLFEMLDSAASFGVFTDQRDWRARDFSPASIGTESYRREDELVVWQSRYVIRLTGNLEATDIIGRLLSDEITGTSRKAPVSTLLPRQGLVPDSEKYILSSDRFEELTGLDAETLGFHNSAEAAIATYRSGEGDLTKLAIVLYPTQHLARLYMESWLETLADTLPNRRTGPLIGIAIDGHDDAFATSLLDALRYESEVTWNAPRTAQLTLPQLILTVFTWIGIALGFVLIAGLGYGGLRIYLKTRYPDRFLGSSPNTELIQLKIDQSVRPDSLPKDPSHRLQAE